MSKYVATALDTTGIQSYIFTSNRLRENIGASYLVAQATDGWVRDKLEELGVPEDRQNEPITDSGLVAELVYAGGGNAVIIFKSMEDAKQFTQKLSRYLLKFAPGINLVAAHQEFGWSESLYNVVKNIIDNKLEQQKKARANSVPLLGLGVTASCRSTQLVAVDSSKNYIDTDEKDYLISRETQNYIDTDEKDYLISRETQAKLIATSPKHGNQANKTLRENFQEILEPKNLRFPYRMDHLGRTKDESSYYAVIHIDGNNMGQRFQNFGLEGMNNNPQDPNRGYIDAMRNLSNNVSKAGLKAMEEVIKILVNSIENNKVMGEFTIKDNFLPLRPLVYGGDDITFVCDGRLGLELAVIYLQKFQEQQVTACAGVCIVKSHYPFARAYQLSEQLCRNAKKFVREQRGEEYSAIDWHIAASGLFGSIKDIRQREYLVEDGNLSLRPVLIQQEENQWRNWSNFTHVVEFFKGNKNDEECQIWKDSRNKVIALREKLREGKEATKQFLKVYKLSSLPTIRGGDDITLSSEGWTEKTCGYFDAIEAMEFYFPLNQGDSNDSLQTENQATE